MGTSATRARRLAGPGRPPAAGAEPRRISPGRMAPWLTLAIGLGATFGAAHLLRVDARRRAEVRLHRMGEAVEEEVRERVVAWMLVLRALAGLIAVGGDALTPDDWRRFTTTLCPGDEWRGLVALRYARHVRQDELEAHLARLRASWPELSPPLPAVRGDDHMLVTLSEPLAGQSPGYDLFADPLRRTAIARAAATGKLAGTGAVPLADGRTGLVLYLPVHEPGAAATPDTVRGLVAASIAVDALLEDPLEHLQPGLVSVALYEGIEPRPGALREAVGSAPAPGLGPVLDRLEIGGQVWTLSVAPGPVFLAELDPWGARMALVGGIAFSLALAGLVGALLSTRAAALQEARRTALQLARREEALRELHRLTTRTDLELPAKSARLLELACRHLELPAAVHARLGEGRYEVLGAHGLPGIEPGASLPAGESFLERLAGAGGALALAGSAADALWSGHPLASRQEARCYLGVAVPTGEGEQVTLELIGPASALACEGGEGLVELMGRWLADERGRLRAAAERRRFEGRVLEMQKLESLGVLASGIAHDFNNMLQAILGSACLVRAALPEGGPDRARLEDVVATAHRASRLTEQLLAYAGHGQLLTRPLDVSRLVDELMPLLGVAMSRRVELRLELAPGLPAVEVDRSQLEQALVALVSNASEAVGAGPGAIVLRTRLEEPTRARLDAAVAGADLPEGRYVALEVEDSGCGMTDEQRRRMFDPFFSTKFPGRGLGLAAVLGIVRSHGGAVEVATTAGAGTTVRLLLPAAAVALAEPPPARGSSPSLEETPSLREPAAAERPPRTVLLVDDEPLVRRTVSAILERQGYRVLAAADGREALERLEQEGEQVALVVLDMTMPVMSGEECFRRLRALRPGLPVIASSGYTEGSPELLAAPGTAFLHKPYTPTTLLRTIEQLAPARA